MFKSLQASDKSLTHASLGSVEVSLVQTLKDRKQPLLPFNIRDVGRFVTGLPLSTEAAKLAREFETCTDEESFSQWFEKAINVACDLFFVVVKNDPQLTSADSESTLRVEQPQVRLRPEIADGFGNRIQADPEQDTYSIGTKKFPRVAAHGQLITGFIGQITKTDIFTHAVLKNRKLLSSWLVFATSNNLLRDPTRLLDYFRRFYRTQGQDGAHTKSNLHYVLGLNQFDLDIVQAIWGAQSVQSGLGFANILRDPQTNVALKAKLRKVLPSKDDPSRIWNSLVSPDELNQLAVSFIFECESPESLKGWFEQVLAQCCDLLFEIEDEKDSSKSELASETKATKENRKVVLRSNVLTALQIEDDQSGQLMFQRVDDGYLINGVRYPANELHRHLLSGLVQCTASHPIFDLVQTDPRYVIAYVTFNTWLGAIGSPDALNGWLKSSARESEVSTFTPLDEESKTLQVEKPVFTVDGSQAVLHVEAPVIDESYIKSKEKIDLELIRYIWRKKVRPVSERLDGKHLELPHPGEPSTIEHGGSGKFPWLSLRRGSQQHGSAAQSPVQSGQSPLMDRSVTPIQKSDSSGLVNGIEGKSRAATPAVGSLPAAVARGLSSRARTGKDKPTASSPPADQALGVSEHITPSLLPRSEQGLGSGTEGQSGAPTPTEGVTAIGPSSQGATNQSPQTTGKAEEGAVILVPAKANLTAQQADATAQSTERRQKIIRLVVGGFGGLVLLAGICVFAAAPGGQFIGMALMSIGLQLITLASRSTFDLRKLGGAGSFLTIIGFACLFIPFPGPQLVGLLMMGLGSILTNNAFAEKLGKYAGRWTIVTGVVLLLTLAFSVFAPNVLHLASRFLEWLSSFPGIKELAVNAITTVAATAIIANMCHLALNLFVAFGAWCRNKLGFGPQTGGVEEQPSTSSVNPVLATLLVSPAPPQLSSPLIIAAVAHGVATMGSTENISRVETLKTKAEVVKNILLSTEPDLIEFISNVETLVSFWSANLANVAALENALNNTVIKEFHEEAAALAEKALTLQPGNEALVKFKTAVETIPSLSYPSSPDSPSPRQLGGVSKESEISVSVRPSSLPQFVMAES